MENWGEWCSEGAEVEIEWDGKGRGLGEWGDKIPYMYSLIAGYNVSYKKLYSRELCMYFANSTSHL